MKHQRTWFGGTYPTNPDGTVAFSQASAPMEPGERQPPGRKSHVHLLDIASTPEGELFVNGYLSISQGHEAVPIDAALLRVQQCFSNSRLPMLPTPLDTRCMPTQIMAIQLGERSSTKVIDSPYLPRFVSMQISEVMNRQQPPSYAGCIADEDSAIVRDDVEVPFLEAEGGWHEVGYEKIAMIVGKSV